MNILSGVQEQSFFPYRYVGRAHESESLERFRRVKLSSAEIVCMAKSIKCVTSTGKLQREFQCLALLLTT